MSLIGELTHVTELDGALLHISQFPLAQWNIITKKSTFPGGRFPTLMLNAPLILVSCESKNPWPPVLMASSYLESDGLLVR